MPWVSGFFYLRLSICHWYRDAEFEQDAPTQPTAATEITTFSSTSEFKKGRVTDGPYRKCNKVFAFLMTFLSTWHLFTMVGGAGRWQGTWKG